MTTPCVGTDHLFKMPQPVQVRTGPVLGALAVIFIVIIIILCLIVSTPPGNSKEGLAASSVGDKSTTKAPDVQDTTTQQTTTTTQQTTTTTQQTTTTTQPTTTTTPQPTESSTSMTEKITEPITEPTTTTQQTTTAIITEPTTEPTTTTQQTMTAKTTEPTTEPTTTTQQTTTAIITEPPTQEIIDSTKIYEETTPESTTDIYEETTPESTTDIYKEDTTTQQTTTAKTTEPTTEPTTTTKQTTTAIMTEPTTEPTTQEIINSTGIYEETTPVSTTDIYKEDTTTQQTTTAIITEPITEPTTTTQQTTTEIITEPTTQEIINSTDIYKDTTTQQTMTEIITEPTTEPTITTQQTTPEIIIEPTTEPTITTQQTTTEIIIEPTTEPTTQEIIKVTTDAYEETTPVPTTQTTDEPEETIVPYTRSTEDIYETTRDEGVCNTKECKRLAAKMLHMMDNGPDVRPCEDFYKYSCGGVLDNPFFKPDDREYLVREQIKSSLMKVNKSDPGELLGPMRSYYDLCLNDSARHNETEMKSQFQNAFNHLGYVFNPNGIGSYPMVTGYNEEFDLTSVVAKMMKMHFTPFFDIMLDVDELDQSKFALKITPPLFQSPFTNDLAKSVCLKNFTRLQHQKRLDKEKLDLNEAYNIFIKCMSHGEGLKARIYKMPAMLENMKLTAYINNETIEDNIIHSVPTTLNFFLEDLHNHMPDPASLRAQTLAKNYTSYTMNELYSQRVFSEVIDWKQLVTELVGQDHEEEFSVHVYFKERLDGILEVLEMEMDDELNLQNMILALWSERLYYDLVEPVDAGLRSESYCYRATVNLMEDFTSVLYLESLQDRETKEDMIRNMVDFSKEAAREMLARHGTNKTEDLLTKLHHMIGSVADLSNARKTLEDNLRNDYLYGPKLKEMTESFVDASMMLLERYRRMLYQSLFLNASYSSQLWRQFLLPHSYSGVAVYALNQFLIPFGAMEAPLYHPGVPEYLNYAGVGHMIAHEIMHAFDSTGIHYGNEGKENMTTPDDFQYYSEQIASQLGHDRSSTSSTNLLSVFKLNKDLKFNEVLAESGAAQLAWEAYLQAKANDIGTNVDYGPLFSNFDSARRRRSEDSTMSSSDGGRRLKRQALFPTRSSSSSYPLPSIITSDQRLPWINHSPIQLFFLRLAQNHCDSSSELNLLTVMESANLPPKLRVNYIFKNQPLFAAAFKCDPGLPMNPTEKYPYRLG
ncbi:hypothetical protein Pmani_005041 [Petrolisthes manimaculis]|uniref:Uncharacterized protein n=1 Tax=Petrolisthes manimaculis TaxID=1843537 RepID=A0AAE1QDI2_9EUCA|nr:hypothetical protein Pmani_005041 [Petrolisthes manimaculis]